MKIHRFIGDFDFSKNEVEITNPENIKQIKDVLRLKKGEKIILSDGLGNSAEVILGSVSVSKIIGTIDKFEKKDKTKRKVSLYLAILKKENFELATQKAVETGVSEIIPVITERTIKTGLNIERLKKIILEASEQSGRNFVPALSPVLKFKDALISGSNVEEKVIFHPIGIIYSPSTGSTSSPQAGLGPSANKEAQNISIFVGPEGGFTEKEINLAKNSGYSIASLGHLTLRAETAAIIATYRVVKGI